MIYVELFLLVSFFTMLGFYLGIQLSVNLLNKKFFAELAEETVTNSIKVASSIHSLMIDYLNQAMLKKYDYDSPEVKDQIKKGINLN